MNFRTTNRLAFRKFLAGLASVLIAMPSLHAAVPELSFCGLSPTYSGEVCYPTTLCDQIAVPARFSCREIESLPSAFKQLPDALGLSYISLGFSCSQTSALGNAVIPAVDGQLADHAEVVLVTWAKAANYPEWSALDDTGYRHPVTILIQRVTKNSAGQNVLETVEEATSIVHVPWRPLLQANGKTYPYNGYAFKALIPLSGKTLIPNPCLVSVAFNTANSGSTPIGIPGPYNELNVALTSSKPSVGTDADADTVVWLKNGTWFYPASNWGGAGSPMLRLASRPPATPAPALSESTTPRQAGNWHIRATIGEGDSIRILNTVLQIQKASASVQILQSSRSLNQAALGVEVISQPPGLPCNTTYGNSTTTPTTIGSYKFSTAIDDRNYQGTATGIFNVTGITYDEWATSQEIFSTESGSPTADPDGDGIPNHVEYAMGTSPRVAQALPSFQSGPDGHTFVFRQRREMPAARLTLQTSADLTEWLTPSTTTLLSSDAEFETRSITSQEPVFFARLAVNPL